MLAEIAAEAPRRARHGSHRGGHRVGELQIGEASVADRGLEPAPRGGVRGGRDLIEEIKRRLPVWKEEHYTNGDAAGSTAGAAAFHGGGHE